jgi:hypothetical protein
MNSKWQNQPVQITIAVNDQAAPQWLRLLSGIHQLEQTPSNGRINGHHRLAQPAPAELIGRSGYALYPD